MSLSTEPLEQYFNSWLDFLRMGPYQFFGRYKREAKHYVSPFQFVLGSLAVLSIVWAITFGYYATLPADIRLKYPEIAPQLDPKMLVTRQEFFMVLFLLVQILLFRLVLRWPLRWKGTVVDVLGAQAYVLAFSVVLAAAETALTPVALWIGVRTNLRIAIATMLGMLLLISSPFCLYYSYTSLSAWSGFKRRHLLEAVALVGLTFGSSVGCLISLGLLGVMIWHSGMLLGGARSKWLLGYVPLLLCILGVYLALWWGRRLALRAASDSAVIEKRMTESTRSL